MTWSPNEMIIFRYNLSIFSNNARDKWYSATDSLHKETTIYITKEKKKKKPGRWCLFQSKNFQDDLHAERKFHLLARCSIPSLAGWTAAQRNSFPETGSIRLKRTVPSLFSFLLSPKQAMFSQLRHTYTHTHTYQFGVQYDVTTL